MNLDSLLGGGNGNNRTLYEVLNISTNSTHEEISRAHRKLALRYHPDKLKEPKDEDILEYTRIQKAYQYLSDDNFRAIYKKNNVNFTKSKEEHEKYASQNSQDSQNDDELYEKRKNHSIDLNLTVEEIMKGGTFTLNVPIYNNTHYPLTKKTVNIILEPNIFPKSVISLSNIGLEPVNIQLNTIRSNKKHTTQIQPYIKYSFDLLGLNHIKLKLKVPMSYISDYLWNTYISCKSNDYNGVGGAYAYIELPNEQWMVLPCSDIINDLMTWTQHHDLDIDDGYYCLSGMGLKSNDGTVGNMYVQFSMNTFKYPKNWEGTTHDEKLNDFVLSIDSNKQLINVSYQTEKDFSNICFKKDVEEKAYQEKQQYLISQKITHLDGVTVTPVT